MSFNSTNTVARLLSPGGHFNIKMPSYQNRNSHYKGKIVSQLSYLHTRNPITSKDGFYIETGPGVWDILGEFQM